MISSLTPYRAGKAGDSCMQTLILASTAVSTALITGLFYAYTCSVIPGLHPLPDGAYLAAMQSINRAILNPVFFLSFLGTLLLLPLSTWLAYGQSNRLCFGLLFLASGIYILGVIGVTLGGNVPLNDALDAVALTKASSSELARLRTAFEPAWTRWHTIRTVACLVTLILVIVSCLSQEKTP